MIIELVDIQINLRLDDRLMYVTGNSGTGKTYLAKLLDKYARVENVPICVIDSRNKSVWQNMVKEYLDSEDALIVFDNLDLYINDVWRDFVSQSKCKILAYTRNICTLGNSAQDFKQYEVIFTSSELICRRCGDGNNL